MLFVILKSVLLWLLLGSLVVVLVMNMWFRLGFVKVMLVICDVGSVMV